MNYSKTRMASFILAFGIFFTLSCSHFERTNSSDNNSESYEEQLVDVNTRLERNPDNTNLQVEKANILFNLALEYSNPKQRTPYYFELRDLADSYFFSEGEYHPDIESTVNQAWTTEQSEGVRLLQQERDNLTEEKTESIVAHFENAITINPDSLSTYNLLANTFYRSGSFNNAISTLEKADEISPDSNTSIKEKLAYLYLEAGDIEQSIRLYLALIEEVPSDAHLLHGLSNAYIINEQHDEAIEILRGLAEQYSTRFEYKEALATQLYFVLRNSLNEISTEGNNLSFTSDDKDPIFELIDEIDSIFESLMSNLPFSEEQLVRSGAFYKNTAAQLNEISIDNNESLDEEIELKRIELLEKALPIWERLFENHPENTAYIQNLYSIYIELGRDEEAESLQRSFNL